ncbi:hypothetical protein ACQGRJ_11530 [Bacillus atrophaeus]|uniref:hypothetical protein n=1 Tax=Bacillus atrophaeus TaxID=1452 RepID=UPI003CF67A9A
MKCDWKISCIIKLHGNCFINYWAIIWNLKRFLYSRYCTVNRVLAGLLVLLSLKSRGIEVQAFIVGSSTTLGIIGAGILYFPAAIINVLIGFKLIKKLKEENTKKQI